MTQRLLLLTAAASVLALAACDRAQQQAAAPATGAPIAALPLATAAPPPEQVAPYANQLPPAPPLPRARPRRAAYSYIDDAYALGDVFADSPPDYTVAYDGEYPWIWRTGDGAYRVVEDTPDGYREYYYYGDSDYPFLIRDPQYEYAYDGPELVMVYDSYGQPFYDYGPQVADYGTRYFFRARRLYDAAIHEQRRAAYAADWRAHSADVMAIQQQWAAAQARNPDWQRVRQERVSTPPPRFQTWSQERAQRVAYAQRAAPVIAAAPAVARPAREPRPQMALVPPPGAAPREAEVGKPNRFDAQLAAEQQALQADQRHQAELAASAQRQAQDRAMADQRRQADAAARDQRQAQAAQDQRAREQEHIQAEAQAQAQNKALAEQRRQADVAAREQRQAQAAQAQQAQRDQQMSAQRAAHEHQAQAQQAERLQPAASERAAHEQQVQQAQRAERQQQMASERAAHEQQAQQAHAQQAQAQQARAAEQQQRQAQAAAQHAQQAAAQVQQHAAPGGGGHPQPQKPDKKEKPQQ
jgi:hypothetical protein